MRALVLFALIKSEIPNNKNSSCDYQNGKGESMSKLYEVVELANGDFALKNDDIESEESLVSMKFSAELKNVLQDAKIDLARVMVEAGLEFVAKLAEERAHGISSLKSTVAHSEISEIMEADNDADVMLSRKISENIDVENDQLMADKEKLVKRKQKKTKDVLNEDLEEIVSHLVH
jgi:hypothetical protein